MSVDLIETLGDEPLVEYAEQVFVAMRDGTRLATDIYLPAKPKRHPAVLVRTPYDKTSRYTALKYHAKYYTERGYVFVTQDVRGKHRSSGDTVPYHFDVEDAYDTIDWIAAQPWSDQTVGLTGASYYGFTTWAGVASGHPAVRAAIPTVTGVEMGANHVGSMWTQTPPSLLGLNDLIQIWTTNNSFLLNIDYAAAPVTELLKQAEALVGHSLPVTDLIERARTGEYYNPYGGQHPYYTTNVPILHWVNWYDPGLAPSGMADWRHFRSLPGHRDLHFLRAGSADHSGFALADVGDFERHPYLNEAAMHALNDIECNEAIDFFDEHVRGIRPERRRPRARWHLGHDGWRSSDEWQPATSRDQVLYLSPGADQRGALATARDAQSQQVTWTHDPGNPVPSTCTIEEAWYLLAVYPDERHLAERPDVLTFTSAPLAEPLDIAGRPVLQAEITSTGSSFHLFAILHDVEPDGTTRPISRANLTTRSTGEDPVLLPLDDIAYRFRTGHRIQLQLRSSDFPHFLVHPGTDDNPWFATTRATTQQSIRTGGTRAAGLTLPVLNGFHF
ncbi:MAG: CocE/NonD family hydrolase [Catenulispora sp.]|nr:CocE/NonD family hydrolase [Catenulispora sp.]